MIQFLDFIHLVKGKKIYLAVPKFAFDDPTLDKLICHLRRDYDIDIFSPVENFKSNAYWIRFWKNGDWIKSRFNACIVWTGERSLEIGKGCADEIDAFLKSDCPVYHLTFNQQFQVRRLTGFRVIDEDNWRRYAVVETDDQETYRPQENETAIGRRRAKGERIGKGSGQVGDRKPVKISD